MKLCECGCNKVTKWNKQFKRYNTYLNGHGQKGKKWTEEQKETLKKTRTREKCSMWNRKHSEETKKKMSKCKLGIKNPMHNKIFTNEERKRRSEAHKGKIFSKETRKKLRLINLGKKDSI
tara:strand:- start:728 stop:1087 length:360 start_codon:yes stop_codon:yes gene_type:complete